METGRDAPRAISAKRTAKHPNSDPASGAGPPRIRARPTLGRAGLALVLSG